MREFIYNKPEMKERRRDLRNNAQPAERQLWKMLQKSQTGRKFRRQHSVKNFVLDFYCPSERLCIELDGASHFTAEGLEYDEWRTAQLSKYDIRVIRFENKLVFEQPSMVVERIKSYFTTTDGGDVSTTPAPGMDSTTPAPPFKEGSSSAINNHLVNNSTNAAPLKKGELSRPSGTEGLKSEHESSDRDFNPEASNLI